VCLLRGDRGQDRVLPVRSVCVRRCGLVELGQGEGSGEARKVEQIRGDRRLAVVDAEVGDEPLGRLAGLRELPDRIDAGRLRQPEPALPRSLR
jgi:hypothetical protein